MVTRMVRTTWRADQPAAWRIEVGAQHDVADDRARQEAETVGEAEVARDELGIVGEVRNGQRRGDLHRRDRRRSGRLASTAAPVA